MKKKIFVTMLSLLLVIVSLQGIHLDVIAMSEVTDIGLIAGTDSSYAQAINDKGQILGFSQLEGSTNPVFMWENGQMKNLNLFNGTIDKLNYGHVNGMNEKGQIIGNCDISINNSEINRVAFVWEDGIMKYLESYNGISTSAQAINEKGQIVGFYNNIDNISHAFIWENGNMKDLCDVSKRSYAYDINDQGQVVGSIYYGNSECHAFIWQNGILKDLGTFGGIASTAVAINNKGQVIGRYTLSDNTTQSFIWENGKVIDLGTLYNKKLTAIDVNDKGQIVGYLDGIGSIFLWEDGVIKEMKATSIGSNFEIKDINNRGEIVGWYLDKNGRYRSFIWQTMLTIPNTPTPTPKPTPIKYPEKFGYKEIVIKGIENLYASCLNDKGQVLLSSQDNGNTYIFLWENGVSKELNIFSGIDYSGGGVVTDMNENGQIVGYYYKRDNKTLIEKSVAFIWDNGILRNLCSPIISNSFANAINDKGQVVGEYSTDGKVYRPFVWENGVIKELAPLGNSSYAKEINNNGQVVGCSEDGQPILWENGAAIDLRKNGIDYGEGGNKGNTVFINNKGQIVFNVRYARGAAAFMLENGKIIDVRLVLPSNFLIAFGFNNNSQMLVESDERTYILENLNLKDIGIFDKDGSQTVIDMNNKGQIIGNYYGKDKKNHPFIWEETEWTPTSTPTSTPTVTPRPTSTLTPTSTSTSTPDSTSVSTPTVTQTNSLQAIGYIDTPLNNSKITGIYKVSGWFWDRNGVSKIEVLVDDILVGEAVYGDKRSDIKVSNPQYGNENVGFHYLLDTSDLSCGKHILTIRGTSKNGKQTMLPAKTFTIPASKAKLKIELTNGTKKKYDISLDNFEKFLTWFDEKSSGNPSVKSYYVFDKGNNKSEYILFDKILGFEVKEYN